MAGRVLSEDDVFGPPGGSKVVPEADVFGPPPGFLDYAREAGTSFLQGAKDLPASSMQGVAAANSNQPTYQSGQNPYELAAAGDERFAENLYRPELRTGAPLPVTEDPIWQGGQAIKDFGKEALGPGPGFEGQTWTRDIGGGFGSVAAGIGAAVVNPAAAMVMFGTAGQGEAAQRAVAKKATPEQVQSAARFGSIAGATDLVDALLPSMGAPGRVAGLIGKVPARILMASLAEGGQEGLQSTIQNAIEKGIYNPEKDYMDGVGRDTLVGMIVGGGTKGVAEAVTRETPTKAATPEEVALARATLTDPNQKPGQAPTQMKIEDILQLLANDPLVAKTKADLDQKFPIPGVTPTEPTPAQPPGTLSDDQVFGPTGGLVTPPATSDWLTNAKDTTVSDALNRLNDQQYGQPTPLEGEVLPPSRPEETVPAEIVDFVHKNDPALKVPDKPMGFSELMASEETTRAKPGVNAARMAQLLGSSIYGTPQNMGAVTVKEILQNAFDGIKGLIQKNPQFKGKIDVQMDPVKRTIIIKDNGTGMTPEVLGNQFLQIAGTKKESDRASGGLGIAKMMFLFENKRLNVVTARDGKVSTMVTSGPELHAALAADGEGPLIQTHPMSAKDRQVFPTGSGTMIEVQVPESYVDPSTGETKPIGFNFTPHDLYHPVATRSPLFDDIDVTWNGQPLPIGSAFPIQDYTQFANVNFDWGTARIYVSQDPKPDIYDDNVDVLSNGLWQFSLDLKKNPHDYTLIPRKIIVDLSPRVAPAEPGYPFSLNRQEFAPAVRKDFGQIFAYLQRIYAQEELNTNVENFGDIQFLDLDDVNGKITSSGVKRLEKPKGIQMPSTSLGLKTGDSVSVKDGKLIVGGKEIPELDTKSMADFKVQVDHLKIPQSEIDSNKVILHDNTLVPATGTPLDAMANSPTRYDAEGKPLMSWEQELFVDPNIDDGMPKISLSQLATQKFGGRFYEFTFLWGQMFKELRDVIAGLQVYEPNASTGLKDYSGLRNEGIGISFDPAYRGVSIRLPFSASFLNIASPVRTDPAGAAVGLIQTMVHELAHHAHRSEKGLAPVMQDIYTQLDLHPKFNFQKFKQRAVNVMASYQDVFQYLNGAFQSGIVTTAGKRFQDSGLDETRDGGVAGNLRDSADGATGGSRLSDWRALSQSVASGPSGRSQLAPGAGTARSRSATDPSFGANSNQSYLNGEAAGQSAAQHQPEVDPARESIRRLFGRTTPRSIGAMAAHADRINWIYKWMAGLTQLTDANPNFTPLVTYTETVRMMHTDEAQIQDAALRIGKDWRKLGKQAESLTMFLHDLSNMTYLTDAERAANVERHPSAQEFQVLVDKHKLTGEALKVFNKVKGLFDVFIKQVTAVQMEKATRGMTDPVRIAEKMDQIRDAGNRLLSRPYFPFMNFGKHFVEVRNSAGDKTEFYTFERSGLRSAERMQMNFLEKMERVVAARGLGETLHHGILSEAADPFIGMPPQLLEAIKSQLQLTPGQITALDQMRVQSTSSVSFKNRFSNAKVVPGYSMDFQRAFAKYFFHGARYYARTKYAANLRDNINDAQTAGGNKASRIAEYMADHLENAVLDAKSDLGVLKGAIFLWAMGYVPAAAFQNLSQTPMITYPFLWGKFGNYSATKALSKAMANLSTYYKKGTYEGMVRADTAGFELKAIDYGIRSGRISETQAPELAGLAQGEGLIKGIGGNWASQKAVVFQEKAAWMFEMAEQFNRRIAYRAGLYLGMTKPDAPEVKVATKKYAQEFALLQTPEGGNYTAAQAKAIITAIHTVDQTQFVYARYARARFMRGKLPGTIFVFKQYMQSTLMMLAQNKSDVLPRAMLMWALLGGLAALPGWDDWKEIIKGIARWKFGKEFDLERELRQAIMHYAGDAKGEPMADLALHGFARKGFGVPAILDLLGSLYTGRPGRGLNSNTHGQNVPMGVTDMSRAISMGNILPFEIGKMIDPNKPNDVIGEQTQKASGAAFSVGFNMYRAMFDNQHSLTDPKRWEKAVPRALAMTSRAFRSYQEGRERTTLGGPNSAATLVNYDVRDTEHLMELLAIGAGFQTERITSRWDRIMAQVEVEKFYDLKRKGLMAQFFEASRGQNQDEVETVRTLIKQHNDSLPDYARGYTITGDSLRRSMQTRARELNARETGVPVRKTARPVSDYLNSLFPSTPVDMRRVD